MTTMTMFFFGKRHIEKLAQVEKNERVSSITHQNNLRTIAKAKEKADTLKQVLEANHITIQIQKATGNKNENGPTLDIQPAH